MTVCMCAMELRDRSMVRAGWETHNEPEAVKQGRILEKWNCTRLQLSQHSSNLNTSFIAFSRTPWKRLRGRSSRRGVALFYLSKEMTYMGVINFSSLTSTSVVSKQCRCFNLRCVT